MDKSTIYKGISIISFMLMSVLISYGQHRYVDNYGNDNENACLNPDKPCRSIQHAVDTAIMGDTISLSAGVYTEAVYIDKDLILLGAGAHRTIIQAAEKMEDAQSRVLHLDIPFGQELFVHIEGITVQKGRAVGQFPVNQGGGILNKGTLSMKDVIIRDNYAGSRGGGLCDRGSLYMEDVRFINNTAETMGGGMYGDYWDKEIRGCEFIDNTAYSGGGIYMLFLDTVKIIDTYYYGNKAEGRGGGIALSNIDYYISEGEIYENNSAVDRGGGAYLWTTPRLVSSGSVYKGNVVREGDGGGIYAQDIIDFNFDGFSFVENRALGEYGSGGGFYLRGKVGIEYRDNTRLIMKNGEMLNNRSAYEGAAGFLYSFGLYVLDSTEIILESSQLNWGGIYFWGRRSAPITAKIRNCKINHGLNSAIYFSAVLSESEIVNTLFVGSRDATMSGPGLLINDLSNDFFIQNCTFVDYVFESKNSFGVITCRRKDASGSINIKNCIFHNSVASSISGVNLYADEKKDIFNVSYSNIGIDEKSIYPVNAAIIGEGVVDVDPLFKGQDDYSLSEESPLINAGDPDTDMSVFPIDENGESIDLAGNPRIMNDTIDMGAYETFKPENRREKLHRELVEIEQIVCYPSPAQNYVMLEFPDWAMITDAQAEIFDESGRKVISLSLNGELISRIDTGELLSGTYYIRLWDDGKLATGKFVLVK